MGLPEYTQSARDHFHEHAEHYKPQVEKTPYARFLDEELRIFADVLTGPMVLDIGSGVGTEAAALKQRGLKPVCIDVAPAMAQLSKQKGLDTVLMDAEHLGFGDAVADGIWAHSSLHFMPKRNCVAVLEQLHRILKPEGLVYVALPEGNYNGWAGNGTRKEGTRRWCAMYDRAEATRILRTFFDIIATQHVNKKVTGSEPFMNFLCKKD